MRQSRPGGSDIGQRHGAAFCCWLLGVGDLQSEAGKLEESAAACHLKGASWEVGPYP